MNKKTPQKCKRIPRLLTIIVVYRSNLCPAQLVKCRPLEILLLLDAWREGEREIVNQSFFNKNRQTIRGVD